MQLDGIVLIGKVLDVRHNSSQGRLVEKASMQSGPITCLQGLPGLFGLYEFGSEAVISGLQGVGLEVVEGPVPVLLGVAAWWKAGATRAAGDCEIGCCAGGTHVVAVFEK